MTKVVAPSTKQTAFSCPYCGAYTTQQWYQMLGWLLSPASPLPNIPDAASPNDLNLPKELAPARKAAITKYVVKSAVGDPFIESDEDLHSRLGFRNLHTSTCFHCKRIAVWVHKRLVHPAIRLGPPPNQDLPEEIRADYEEARSIVELSPRGAAALLRLCVQKLCAHLGGSGKDINADIAALVKNGLHPIVQQSLDVVRVIGNESVHPGELDLRDDQDTAVALFSLINVIAEQMITQPKVVQDLYAALPAGKRAGIEARDRGKP